jgi:hypothetical protein
MHTRLRNWKARRSGAHITVTGDAEGGAHATGYKAVVDVIEPRDGKVFGVRFKPREIGRSTFENEREVDEEFELLAN